MTGRVMGIAGVRIHVDDADSVRAWYGQKLGLVADDGGAFRFPIRERETGRPGRTALRHSASSPDGPPSSAHPCVVVYRVDHLDALLEKLRGDGEEILEGPTHRPDGRVARLRDPEGRDLELAEPGGEGAGEPASSAGGADVTGIGGIFLKSPDPAALKEWYRSRLGIEPDEAGYVVFSWLDEGGEPAYLSWEVFPADSDYFGPGTQPYMVNLRVADLDALRERLIADEEVRVDPRAEEFEYGKFGWIEDGAGARVELWEPRDRAFD